MTAPWAVADWGRTRYAEAYARQLALVEQRRQGQAPDTLVLTEHDPVYTIGARMGAERHLLWSAEMLQARGVEVVFTNRGGDITWHGPGQLTGYPIAQLGERFPRDLHKWLATIEDVLTVAVQQHWGLPVGRRRGQTGLWLDDRKLVAIGVAVRQWVTYHGFALNVDCDLDYFGGIVPCGISDARVTSLAAELGRPVPLAEAVAPVVAAWQAAT